MNEAGNAKTDRPKRQISMQNREEIRMMNTTAAGKTAFDPLCQKYPSQRFPIYARGGMVNCSSPLAAAAGLSVLRKGGNAADAAVAAAAALTVVEPTANGIGSDSFALVWSEKASTAAVPLPWASAPKRSLRKGWTGTGECRRTAGRR